MTPHGSDLVRFGIPALAIGVQVAIAIGVVRLAGARRALLFALGVAVWLGVTAGLALSGFLPGFVDAPPRLLWLMVPSIALPMRLGFSRLGSLLAEAPVAWLVGLQSFRLPLELVMHRAAKDGLMPEQMTFTGDNFDIVTGVTAVVVATLTASGHAPRWLLLAWNALGTALLLVILAIAIASLPAFGVFGTEPVRLNTWVAYFPYVWLPAGLVSAAVLGHVLLWRRLLQRGMRGRALRPLS
jgi:hypothetical protein